ncbi:unnamed protein product [Dibothriocephalus latus]|uniref:N-acetylgalactosaminide beta-1,3-galactosyltransferase n=1 Tax=Dibothriocephalus latus TaxID=60516 RepID=A0A3P6SV64_DIBLA|nr:unnamed protein product [Dibothriocephalus latus]
MVSEHTQQGVPEEQRGSQALLPPPGKGHASYADMDHCSVSSATGRPNLNLTKPESRMHLWSKMRKIVRYVYQYRDEYDYFYKADDDNYLFVENLAEELNKRNPDEPFMMGHRFPRFQRVGYFSGGAGYVLSRGALKVLIERAIDKHPSCPTYDEDKEDVKMSKDLAVLTFIRTHPFASFSVSIISSLGAICKG